MSHQKLAARGFFIQVAQLIKGFFYALIELRIEDFASAFVAYRGADSLLHKVVRLVQHFYRQITSQRATIERVIETKLGR